MQQLVTELPDPAIFANLLSKTALKGVVKEFVAAEKLKSYKGNLIQYSKEVLNETIIPAFEDLFQPSRYKIFYGGRGGAKSMEFANALIILAHAEKLRILCTREYQSSIDDSVYRLLCDRVDDLGLSESYTITKKALTHVNGSEFLFKGLQRSIREIRSMQGIDICWVEEAQAISETSWEVLIPTIRKRNSEIWMSFNPDDEKDPTFRRFVSNSPPDSILKKVSYKDNPLFPDVLEKERLYMLSIDQEAYEHVWGGECRKISDAIVFRGRFEISTFPEPPENTRFYYGLDFGFSVSPTAFTRCFVRDNILYVDYEAWGVGVEIDDTPDFLDTIPGAGIWPIKADCARPETISHLKRRGYRVESAPKWPGSVEDGLAVLKSFEKIIIHERCPHTAENYKLYSYKVDRKTDEILPILVKKNDDCIDAIRYGLGSLIKVSFFDGCNMS